MKINFCAAPWRGLHISTAGEIRTCCAGKLSFGNIISDDIGTALQNPKLKEIRKSIINGELPDEYCGGCKMSARKKLYCEMDWHNSLNDDFNIEKATTNYDYSVIFDARWNNTCNSSCLYCGPRDSSKWASILEIESKKNNITQKENISNFFEQNKENLKTVSMIGGEPLLINENVSLIDKIPVQATIDVITNLNVDLEKNKVFQKLLAKKKVHWHISFDNTEDQYEYVRQGSKWDLLKKNLKILGQFLKNPAEKNDHEIQIMSVYNLLNATNMCKLKNFAQEAVSFFPYLLKNSHIQIIWQDFTSPAELNIVNYGIDVLKLAIQEIEKYEKQYLNENEKIFFDSRKIFYKNILQDTTVKTKEKLSNFIKKNEKIFNNEGYFNRLWPEYSFLIN